MPADPAPLPSPPTGEASPATSQMGAPAERPTPACNQARGEARLTAKLPAAGDATLLRVKEGSESPAARGSEEDDAHKPTGEHAVCILRLRLPGSGEHEAGDTSVRPIAEIERVSLAEDGGAGAILWR